MEFPYFKPHVSGTYLLGSLPRILMILFDAVTSHDPCDGSSLFLPDHPQAGFPQSSQTYITRSARQYIHQSSTAHI